VKKTRIAGSTLKSHNVRQPSDTWYVQAMGGQYGVTLTTEQTDAIAKEFPDLNNDAEDIRSAVAALYTYDPNQISGGLPTEIINSLQDTYGQEGIALSDAQIGSMVEKYLPQCVRYTTDGLETDTVACMTAINAEIDSAARSAAAAMYPSLAPELNGTPQTTVAGQ
jgi:cell division protein ZapA (FtsZ GTPase activity inhibitor)